MGPLPNTWWMRYSIDSVAWAISVYETFHFDAKNRAMFLFQKPANGSIWANYWTECSPKHRLISNVVHRNPHVGWFIWNWGVKVEKMWNRIR